jgi:hypothetical protein
MTPEQRAIFIGTGPRSGQGILIPVGDGSLPNLIAFPNPPGDHLEGAHEPVDLVAPGAPGSTTYVLIQTENDPRDLPMYYEVTDESAYISERQHM